MNRIAERQTSLSNATAVGTKYVAGEVGSGRSDQPIMVRFDRVSKTYDGENLVVQDLNLDVRCGEFLTLLGPSGSGKTTTLMLLAGFEPITVGDIIVGGRSLRDVPPYKRNIGVVFQNYALFPHMNVAENVAFPLTARRRPKSEIRERVARALEMVQLDAYRKRRPGQLSGGQQQRVALARALVFEPQVVLMDEPLGALDKRLREQMQVEIQEIQRSVGVTVVYVTHDQAEALAMSDRIVVFNDGHIEQVADPERLYERPETPFVAGFIGENNRIDGQIVEGDESYCVVDCGPGRLVRAVPVRHMQRGESVQLSIRPENIVINPPAGSYANALQGTVTKFIYMGDYTRVSVDIGMGNRLDAKLHPRGDMKVPDTGQAVLVGWNADACRAFPVGP